MKTSAFASRQLRLIIRCLIFSLLGFIAGSDLLAYTDSMTDQDFFGVWNGSTWTTNPKINYSYNSDVTLAAVGTAARAGNYTQAKATLLTYYKNRTGHAMPPLSATGAALPTALYSATLVHDNILTGSDEIPQNEFTVDGSDSPRTVDVTSGVNAAIAVGATRVGFYLMGRNKDDTKSAQFYSHDQGSNAPSLTIVAGGNTMPPLTASQDTYTSAGAPDTNFGAGNLLYVQDSGLAANAVYDANTRRTYIAFDLSGFSTASTVTSATLSVVGKLATGTGSMKILVMYTDVNWAEGSLKWANQNGNTFSWNGLASGPDWNEPSTGAFNEYYYLISRFQFLGPLMIAFQNNGDSAYVTDAIRLMRQFIQAPHPAAPSGLHYQYTYDYPRSLEVGFRTYLWPRVMPYLLSSSALTADDLTGILKNLWQSADWQTLGTYGHGSGNWLSNETNGLYTMAVYFPELTDPFTAQNAGWKETAEARLIQVLSALIRLDGSYIEGSYNYAGQAELANLVATKSVADLNEESMTPTYLNAMKKLATFIMDETLPNGYDPVYGDGHYSGPFGALVTVGDDPDLNMPDVQYVATVGARGTPSSHLSNFYPDGLTVTMRTGWTPNDKYLFFANSAGTHGHEDQNEVIAYAYGKVLLTDTGINSYLSTDQIAVWQYGNAESHNTIKINSLHQDKYNSAMSTNRDTIDLFRTNGTFDLAQGTTYSVPGFTYTRDVMFVRPNYWIVSDLVTGGSGTNTYDQDWHMVPGANPTLDNVTKAAASNFGTGNPNIQVVPADPAQLTSASLNDGWYDRTSTPNEKFTKYRKTVPGNVTFDTVLYPLASGQSATATVSRLALTPSATTDVATAIKISLGASGGNKIGRYYLSHETRPDQVRSFDSYDYDGKMAYVETDASNNLLTAAVAQGRTLRLNKGVLIQSNDPIDDLGVQWNGGTLAINGSNLTLDSGSTTAIAIYAPSATSVMVNGVPAAFSMVGNFVYAARAAASASQASTDFGSMQGQGGWLFEKDVASTQPLTWSVGGAGSGTTGSDLFSNSTLNGVWHWVNQNSATWSLTAVPGKMRIQGESGDLWDAATNQSNLLLQWPAYPDYQLETKVSFTATSNVQSAGLILYVDGNNYVKLERAYSAGKQIRFVREFTDPANGNAIVKDAGVYVTDNINGDIYLRLRKVGLQIVGFYSADGITWTQLSNTFDVPAILDTAAVGLEAMNTSTGAPLYADFDYFNVTQYLPANWSGGSGDPIITANYTMPGSSAPAVQKWVASSDGTAMVVAKVASWAAKSGGDGFQVRVTKNGLPIWPATTASWQFIANSDIVGTAINVSVQVAKGDVLGFVTDKIGTTAYDVAAWTINVSMAQDRALRFSDFESPGAASWTPLTVGRWTLGADGSTTAYSINTTGYALQSGGRPGEYSVRNDIVPDRFRLSVTARVGDSVATTPDANGVIIFNYLDANNYYFFLFSNDLTANRLYKVQGGVATILADADGKTDWVADNNYHVITIDRDSISGSIVVNFDGVVALRGNDTSFRGGGVGVGSMNRKAYFDNVGVLAVPARADAFSGDQLDPFWSWIRPNAGGSSWSLTAAPGALRLSAGTGDLWWAGNDQPNILLRSSPYTDFNIVTRVTFRPTTNYQSAGLIAYVDDDNYIKVERCYNGGNLFRVLKEVGGQGAPPVSIPDPIVSTDAVYLKMVKAASTYTGYYSSDGLSWNLIGTFTGVTFPGTSAPRVGLGAQRSGSASSIAINADFDSFTITSNSGGERFDSSTLDASWSWYNENASSWSLSAAPGSLKITADIGDLLGTDTTEKNILLKSPSYDDYTLTTKIDFLPAANSQSAGLIIYEDPDNYLKIERCYDSARGGNVFRMTSETGPATGAQQYTPDTMVASRNAYLKVVKWGSSYSGYFSADGEAWNLIYSYSSLVFQDLHSLKVGLFAQRSSSAASIDAYFDSFEQTGSMRTDDFANADKAPIWSWVREDPENWSLTAVPVPASMRISATTGDLWYGGNDEKNILLRPSPFGDFKIIGKLTFLPNTNYQSAGLIAYVDDRNYIKVDRTYNTTLGGNVFRLVQEVGDLGTQAKFMETTATNTVATVYLMLAKSGTTYHGYFSVDGITWTTISAAGYTASFASVPLVGLHAQRSGGASTVTINADFDFFTVADNSGAGGVSVMSAPSSSMDTISSSTNTSAPSSGVATSASRRRNDAVARGLPSAAFAPELFDVLEKNSLVRNGDFEATVDDIMELLLSPTGDETVLDEEAHDLSWDWSLSLNASQTYGESCSGDASLVIDGDGKAAHVSQTIVSEGHTIVPGSRFVLGAWVKTVNQSAGRVYLRFTRKGASPVTIETSPILTSTDGWSYVWTSFAVPAEFTGSRVELVSTVNAGAQVFFDGVYLGPLEQY